MFKKLLVIISLLVMPVTLFAQENQVKIVALVLTTADYNPSSDNIIQTLEVLNAQTLRVESPNASELRSVLKRFAAAALDNDIALVFVDAPILMLGDREFIAPSGIELRRGSDLLTQAIPISAMARAAALAGTGGAVFVHSSDLGSELPEGVTLAQIAPVQRAGTSPIIMVKAGSAMTLSDIFAQHSQSPVMELALLLNDLTAQVEITVSYVPNRAIIIKTPVVEGRGDDSSGSAETAEIAPATESANVVDPVVEAIGATAGAPETNGLNLPLVADTAPEDVVVEEPVVEDVEQVEVTVLSLDLLRALESGLSRAEKRRIQRGLRDLGFYSGLIDGIFGRQTARSIEAYQQSVSAEQTGVLTVSQLGEFIE
ncbi:MAG: peptidoglycan-binding protein [Rhodobacteraceae bacterium]|nr:peptidoglycan-binding protein [Paracoccaceae bacterium]